LLVCFSRSNLLLSGLGENLVMLPESMIAASGVSLMDEYVAIPYRTRTVTPDIRAFYASHTSEKVACFIESMKDVLAP
jgi:hypothetical protein